MAADGDKNGDIPEEIKLHGARDGGADRFVYTYTAPTAEERREIEGIRSQYFPRSSAESKLEYVRKLDKRVRSLPENAMQRVNAYLKWQMHCSVLILMTRTLW